MFARSLEILTIKKLFQVKKNLKRSYYLILRRFNIRTNKPRNTEIDRRTTFSTFADTRATDNDSINSTSVQQPTVPSHTQRVKPTKYEPNGFADVDDDDRQGNVDKRKSVVHFDQNDGNGESRI